MMSDPDFPPFHGESDSDDFGDELNAVADDSRSPISEFAGAVELLSELSHAGLDDFDASLHETVEMLGTLADAVEASLSDFNDDDPEVLELVRFVVESCSTVQATVQQTSQDDNEADNEPLDLLHEAVQLRLETLRSDAFSGDGMSFSASGQDAWDSSEDEFDSVELDAEGPDENSSTDDEVVAPSQEEIAALLSSLSAQTRCVDENAASETGTDTAHADPQPTDDTQRHIDDGHQTTDQFVGDSPIKAPAVDQVDVDDELREAFLDDATRGLESMEQALLDLENSPGADGPVKTVERELHTIKGAAASIGLANLAGYIHELEELIRETQDGDQTITLELLLPHVDLLRHRVTGENPAGGAFDDGMTAVSSPSAAASSTAGSSAITSTPNATGENNVVRSAKPTAALAESHGDDETVRVKASQLNRLMDMLSELVMLRNQRDTEISHLRSIHDELTHSVTRIRMLSHEGEALLANDNIADPDLAEDGVSFSHLNEVANDVMESAQRLRECYRPVADGNEAVSQFIRNFRLELVQLRRMPVSGLFRRLHRAISDAARTEQKQVRVELIGENTGIERSLQERIFEPLLHIVRNSVGHGVETPEERVAAGKPPQGIVQLNAHSGPDLLVIEVRDDGRGLDYDAIRRRGIQRGLIESDKSISRAELARLIFHPGFSTKETANQISGRGVGMDVVASTLQRMRGWVEVESENGCGSTIRLSLPLPSMIQHALVFRSGGQLFALPAQSVRRTGTYDPAFSPIDLNSVLRLSASAGEPSEAVERRSMIELVSGGTTFEGESDGDLAILVDHVLGPEEVVLRPMPPMLKSHPICIGATLSGMGEVVLLLDPYALIEATSGHSAVPRPVLRDVRPIAKEQAKVLVVDDSKSARLRVVRSLEKYPVTVVQVEDGQAAIELMSKESFATVFSDIDMPRMSGLELLELIKGDDRLASTPVIMISSRSLDTAGKLADELGALHYIQKPLHAERLDEIVSGLDWARTP